MYQVSANLTWEAIDTCIMESITVMTEDPVIQQVSPERPLVLEKVPSEGS